MDETTIMLLIFLASVFIANEIVLWKKRQAKKAAALIEHRTYNTGDQIWLRDGKVIRIQTYDNILWVECYPGLVRAMDGGGAVNE